MTITIPDTVIEETKISPHQMLVEIAVYLYQRNILSIGQAKKVANLDLIAFQLELARHNVYIHFDMNDLEKDIKNLNL